jgi:hypothetical protein
MQRTTFEIEKIACAGGERLHIAHSEPALSSGRHVSLVEKFATGFAEGLLGRLQEKQGLATTLTNKILADKFGFYQGCVTGVIAGLLGGLVELLKTVIIVAKVPTRCPFKTSSSLFCRKAISCSPTKRIVNFATRRSIRRDGQPKRLQAS